MRLDTLPAEPFADGIAHLEAECRWLDARLADHVRALREQGRFNEDPTRGLFLTEADVLAALERHRGQSGEAPRDPLRAIVDRRSALEPRPPLAAIASAFGLDEFDRLALLIVAAPALDRRFQTAFAFAQNDVSRRWPTVGLLLDLLAATPAERLRRLDRFAAGAPLMAGALIHCAAGDEDKPLADRALAADDRVVHALLGLDAGLDWRLADCGARYAGAEEADWALPRLELPGYGLMLVEAARDCGQRAMVAQACAGRGLRLLLVDAGSALAGVVPPGTLGRLLGREAMLGGAALLVEAGPSAPSGALEALAAAAVAVGAAVVVAAPPDSLDSARLPATVAVARLRLADPDPARRRGWWEAAIGAGPEADRLAWSTRLGPATIGRLCGTAPGEAVAAARALAARRLPAVMQPVPPRWRPEELLLPAPSLARLDELTAYVAHWPQVIDRWGFGAANPQARHCLALFAGPSGTGKTMAASIVAAAADLDLYRVNLASVFDKYIGETEKQLDRLFDAAADAGVALLFDEADVLFGSRTEVRDSHDRYANLSVAYLLQRVECHEGLVVLASNLPRNMDEAFARRLSHVVAFPMPDPALRRALWRGAFPAAAELDPAVDLPEIAATFELSGGNIRNAALAAAYLAAADGGAIAMPHLLRAITRELEKMGRAPIAADFGRFQPQG
ncbi:MAG TPA: ATP-binding protein [Allosphingosinicella sp.]|jgi:hypothetical protein